MNLRALQSLRQDWGDWGAGGDFLFGGSDLGLLDSGVVDGVTSLAAADVSLSDTLRSGAAADSVDWGFGAQDGMFDADPVAPDSNSSSERLRGIGALQEAGLTREEAFAAAPGGAPADPTIRTGTMDWSSAFKSFASSVGVLGGGIGTAANGLANLAGVRAPTGGTPAPGGNPGPSFLQRLLGPGTGTSARPVNRSTINSGLLLGGLAVGLGYLLFFHRRR
jgi:hypothetical protein